AHVKEVMSNEGMLISSNADNAFLSWGMEEENWSYNYEDYIHDGRWASGLGDNKMNHFFMLFMKTYMDPRVEAFADPSREPFKLVDTLYESGTSGPQVVVEYPIPYLGEPLASSQTLSAWDLPGADNPFSGIPDNNYSYLNYNNFLAEDVDYTIISYAETNFMKAETTLKGWGGSKTAEQYYYEGIDASFEQYGIQGALAYKEREGIKWGTASKGDRHFTGIATNGITAEPFAKIVVQRWIAIFNQGHDGWCLQKRTRAITWPPHLNPQQSRELEWANIPERMVYSPNEITLNGEAYLEAVSRLEGGDELDSPLKMNKPITPFDWETFPAEFNTEFGRHWYGNSIDDLIANGVQYTILNK
ncbi:SusD/RagB family nutrient-binding outer membrane lipoprotein, partial [Bacteroidota bacterium]